MHVGKGNGRCWKDWMKNVEKIERAEWTRCHKISNAHRKPFSSDVYSKAIFSQGLTMQITRLLKIIIGNIPLHLHEPFFSCILHNLLPRAATVFNSPNSMILATPTFSDSLLASSWKEAFQKSEFPFIRFHHILSHGKGAYFIEVGVLGSCEAKAMLPALKCHQAGQQAIRDMNIIAKVALHLVCHCP